MAEMIATLRKWVTRRGSLGLLLLGLSGCGTTVQIQKIAPPVVLSTPGSTLPNLPWESLPQWAGENPERLLQVAEAWSAQLTRDSLSNRPGNALLVAHIAGQALLKSGVPAMEWPNEPFTRRALGVYRNSLTRFLQAQKANLREGAVGHYASDWGKIPLQMEFAMREFPAGYFDRLILADAIAIRGFRDRVTLPGMGVPLVGLRAATVERAPEMAIHPSAGVAAPLNAMVEFSRDFSRDRRTTIRVTDSQETTHGKFAGRRVPLAADFTAPLAFTFGGSNDLMLGIRNLFNVGLGVSEAGVYLAEPPDPKRIPVLLIHGLSSSPIVWRNLANEAMRDPLIRKHYQFWYAYYSTGAPLVYSAYQIRQSVSQLRAKTPGSRAANEMVIVGYSMGGVMAQMLVTDIRDHLWKTITPTPLEQVKLDPEDAEEIRQSLFWKPLPKVDQVIFIATPHRGTQMADASFAHLAGWLVRLPTDFLRFERRVFDALDDRLGGHAAIKGHLTGLDDLSARSPLYPALNAAGMAPSIRLHSIIGDRGRGDSPESSDGIVAYWSSHLDSAESEIIVPTGHDAQASPQTEAEVYRILNEDWQNH